MTKELVMRRSERADGHGAITHLEFDELLQLLLNLVRDCCFLI